MNRDTHIGNFIGQPDKRQISTANIIDLLESILNTYELALSLICSASIRRCIFAKKEL